MPAAGLPLENVPTPWRKLSPVAACGAALVGMYLWSPGSAPFIFDEPELVLRALDLNSRHAIAHAGLTGTLGRPYGPLPLWIYQAMLLVTHDPVSLMSIRIALVAGPTLLALLMIARHSRMTPWPLLIPLASPYTWFYSRLMWDNSFNIPLTFLAVAFYTAWLGATEGSVSTTAAPAKSRRSQVFMFAATALSTMTLLVHPMSLPILGALLGHALLRRRRALLAHASPALLGVMLVACASTFYVQAFLAAHSSLSTGRPALEAWTFALLNPRLLSGAWMDFFFFNMAERPVNTPAVATHAAYLTSAGAWTTAFNAAAAVSLLAFPLAYLSPILNLARLRHRIPESPTQETPPRRSLGPDLCLLAALAIGLQVLLLGVTESYGPPHYYQATLIASTLLVWTTLDWMAHAPVRAAVARWLRGLAGALTATQVAALLTVTLLLAYRTRQTHGTRGLFFGTDLNTQIDVVSRMTMPRARFAIETTTFTESLTCLYALLNVQTDNDAPPQNVTVVYKHPEDPNNAELDLKLEPAK